jgi:hypothetical protein
VNQKTALFKNKLTLYFENELGRQEVFRILIAAWLLMPMMANAGDPEDYRFPRELGTTKDGY